MKRTIVVSCICLVSVLLGPVLASVPIPWSNSFESISSGTVITNYDAWTLTGAGSAYVTNNGDYSAQRQSPKVTYPIPGDTHTKALSFSDVSAANAINGSGSPSVWVDTMIQPIFSQSAPVGGDIPNSQVSLYFGTNGYLNVYHGLQDTLQEGTNTHTNAWTTLTNGFGKVESGKWVRLTVQMSYSPAGYNLVMFKVMINGQEYSDASGFSTNDLDASPSPSHPGPWFVAANWTGSREISSVQLSGSGMVDDMVVANSPVSISPSGITVLSVVSAGKGSISPLGLIEFSSTPAETNFVITASNYWRILTVYTGAVNGASGMVASAVGTNAFDLSMSGLSVDSFVNVAFEAITVGTYGTPKEWLALYGCVSTNSDTGDSDLDGMLDGQEYVAGTRPNNPNSLVKILSETVSSGSNTIQWVGATSTDGSGRLYTMHSSTNLMDNIWPVAASLTLTSGSTNTTVIATPAASPVFYKINATNTATWQ